MLNKEWYAARCGVPMYAHARSKYEAQKVALDEHGNVSVISVRKLGS